MGSAIGATTDSITDSDDSFPNDDFFPDIGNLFLDDMGDNVNTNANADVNTNAGTLMYDVFLLFLQITNMLLNIVFPTLCVVICLQLYSYSLSGYMSSLICVFLVMFFLLFISHKSLGKLLIFPTGQSML